MTAPPLRLSRRAGRRVDIVYCDSWMSYGIAPAERAERLKALMPYQVTILGYMVLIVLYVTIEIVIHLNNIVLYMDPYTTMGRLRALMPCHAHVHARGASPSVTCAV